MDVDDYQGRFEAIRSRPVLLDALRAGWSSRDAKVGDYLDALASQALTDHEAMEWLLFLIADLQLSRPAIYQYLVAVDDVETVEQSTLTVVALKLNQYRGSARFTTWLHRVAANEAKMLIRARSRRPETVVGNNPLEAGVVASMSSLIGDRDVVMKALASLPAEYRSALILREFGGCSYEEVAKTLNISTGTVRSRLNRGRRMLLADIGGYLGGAAASEER